MLYLAFIFHMHQPYYKNLLTQESDVPWVRLHGVKDYLDMAQMLDKFPQIKLTFNYVPSLLEQVEDYQNNTVKDKFLALSYEPANNLSAAEKQFILDNFFMINRETVIALFPRYYDLYFKKLAKKNFTAQDYLDLQVWFNLAWIDPSFRNSIPEFRTLMDKGRFFTEGEKCACLNKQVALLKEIIPAYNKLIKKNQVEVTLSPYYHPILPLLYNTNTAKESNLKTILPKEQFAFPQDVKAQIDLAVGFFKARFKEPIRGMWPSEEAVSEHILPFIIEAGIKWIVADEAILFKSLRRKKRDTNILYQPYLLKREKGECSIIFRDRNLSDLIGFSYHAWETKTAVEDFMKHLRNISTAFAKEDVLVTIALDGENAWEYYKNDGHDFLELLYLRLSESAFLKTTTISEYLNQHPAQFEIKRLSAGSWIYGEFGKWIGNPHKVRAWEYLAIARKELQHLIDRKEKIPELAFKQMYICEGSDWFWWYGEDYPGYFDRLFRMHLSNFYTLIGKDIPQYLNNHI